nr:PEF-CTERM sorting domain-containing protein [uncultured Methanolobus sp.]
MKTLARTLILAVSAMMLFAGTAVAVDTTVSSGDTLVVNITNPVILGVTDTLIIDGTVLIENMGLLTNLGTITVENEGAIVIENGGTFANYGTVYNSENIEISGFLQNSGVIVFNNGNISILQTGELDNSAYLANYGNITNHGIFSNHNTIQNYGTINLYYDGTHSGMENVAPIPVNIIADPKQEIPEFPSVAIPIAAIVGLAFIFQRRKN